MSVETRKTYCRFCLGGCAIDVDVEDGRPVALRGDAGNVREQGSSTNRLVSDETCFDAITGQARQSAIPVSIHRVPGMQ